MKKTLLIILPLLLIVGCSKQVDETTLIEKDGLMHLPNSDKPYTGEVLGNYMTGEKAYTGKYVKGLLVDKYSYYQKNGFKKEPVNINYLIERTNVMYEINALESLTGLVFDLWENGKMKIWGLYKYGLKDGKWDYLRQDGSIQKSEIYHHGQIKESSDFYDNEKLKYSGTYEDGKKVGEWNYIDANGYNYHGSPIKPNINSSGVFMFVDDSFSESASYTNGQKNGSYIKWNNNGQKMEEGRYHFPKFIFEGYDTTLTKSYRSGKWRHFHKNGILEKEGSYSLTASYYLNDSGKPYNIHPSEYKNDWWTYYHDDDVKSAEGKYIFGVKDSLWTYWYTNGQKNEEGTYKDGELISEKCWDEDGNERDCN